MKNIILCAYNWAGCKAIDLLYNKKQYNLFVYTHENPPYINSVKEYCEKIGVSYSLEKIKVSNLPFNPDVIVSIYYRYIIDKDIINICNKRIFNLHPSLLPNYRGTGSITWSIINNEKFSGFTYHYINEKIDAGNIIFQKKIKIEDFDTQVTLYHRVMFDSLQHFEQVLDLVDMGYKGKKQDINEKTDSYHKRGAPFNGEISENWHPSKVERFIRAMIYPPLPYAKFKGKEITNMEIYYKLKV